MLECFQCGRTEKVVADSNGDGVCPTCVNSRVRGTTNANQLTGSGYKPKPIFKGDDPDKLYIGMELETEVLTYDGRPAIIEWLNTPDLIYCKAECSIHYGIEIVTHPLSFGYFTNDFLPYLEMFDSLNHDTNPNGACSSRNRCGLHFHVSKAAFTQFHMYKFLKFLHQNQHFIAVIGERPLSDHCRPYQSNYNHTRALVKKRLSTHKGEYVNTYPGKTIELRFFKGNLDIHAVLKNVEFIHCLYKFTKATSSAHMTPGKLMELLKQKEDAYPNFAEFVETKALRQRVWDTQQNWLVKKTVPSPTPSFISTFEQKVDGRLVVVRRPIDVLNNR